MEDFYFKSAKATFDMICDEMEAEEAQGIIDTSPCGMGVREIFELDLAQFLMFLMSSDGKLDDNEVKAFELMTGRSDSKSEIFGKIMENNLDAKEFATTVPLSLQIIVDYELMLRSEDADVMEKMPSLTDAYMTLLGLIGMMLNTADGEVTPDEHQGYMSYMNMVKSYIQEKGL